MISRIKKIVQKIIVKIILTFSNKLVGRILKINDNLYLIMVSINDIVYIKNEIFISITCTDKKRDVYNVMVPSNLIFFMIFTRKFVNHFDRDGNVFIKKL